MVADRPPARRVDPDVRAVIEAHPLVLLLVEHIRAGHGHPVLPEGPPADRRRRCRLPEAGAVCRHQVAVAREHRVAEPVLLAGMVDHVALARAHRVVQSAGADSARPGLMAVVVTMGEVGAGALLVHRMLCLGRSNAKHQESDDCAGNPGDTSLSSSMSQAADIVDPGGSDWPPATAPEEACLVVAALLGMEGLWPRMAGAG